jgi:protein TonB
MDLNKDLQRRSTEHSFGALSDCMVDADTDSLRRGRRFRGWGLAASVTIQTGLLAALVLVPLVTPAVLPHFVALVPMPVLRPSAPIPVVRAEAPPRVQGEIYAPTGANRPVMHSHTESSVSEQRDPIDIGFGPGGDSRDSILWPGGSSPQPQAPQPPVGAVHGPVHMGGAVMEAMLVNRVEPIYPTAAKNMHVSGSVVISALIAADGSIQSLKVVSGSPLLAGAALTAVREWRYKPTLLNGEPVQVETLITVNFVLDY